MLAVPKICAVPERVVMSATDVLSGSLEDYIEAIFHLAAEKRVARAKDIALRLGVKSSSVTGALRTLATRKLVNYAPYELITLTAKGKVVARDIVRRHQVLRDFFVRVLLVDEKEADEAACKIEHSIPRRVFQRLVEYVDFVDACPRGGAKWVRGFAYHCAKEKNPEYCEQCLDLILKEVRESKRTTKKEKRIMTLSSLKPGEKARVVKVRRGGAVHKRIVDMGVTPGTLVEIRRIAPLGDPVEVKLRGYNLSLRKDEISEIEVEQV